MCQFFDITKLNRQNYVTWARSMCAALRVNCYWVYVSGQKLRPIEPVHPGDNAETSVVTRYNEEYSAWQNELDQWIGTDRIALLYIFLHIDDAHSHVIEECRTRTSREAWELLQQTFAPTDGLRAAMVFRKITRCQFTDAISMSDQLEEYQKTIVEGINAGIELDQQIYCLSLLDALPPSYSQLVTIILASKSVSDLVFGQVILTVKQEEERRQCTSSVSSLKVRRSGRKGKKKAKGDKTGYR